jgi:hypothetical protein
MIQMTAKSKPVPKQFSFSKIEKAQDFAAYYRERVNTLEDPPRIMEVQFVQGQPFECGKYFHGEE